MKEEERKALIGSIMAEYGVKMDVNDPAVIIVDMCSRVLEKHTAALATRSAGSAASAEILAQAVAAAYASKVLPHMQATMVTESKKMMAAVKPASLWTQPAFVAVSCGLFGVIVGFLLHRLA